MMQVKQPEQDIKHGFFDFGAFNEEKKEDQ